MMSNISEIHAGFISNDLYAAAPLSALNHKKLLLTLKSLAGLFPPRGGNIVHFTLVRKQNNCFVFFPRYQRWISGQSLLLAVFKCIRPGIMCCCEHCQYVFVPLPPRQIPVHLCYMVH